VDRFTWYMLWAMGMAAFDALKTNEHLETKPTTQRWHNNNN